MPCIPLKSPDGKSFGIACVRSRKPSGKCANCGRKAPPLECDKCDAKLCDGCGVSPAQGVDLCPSCFAPAWKWWQHNDGRALCFSSVTERDYRRNAFRVWVRQHTDQFLQLVDFKIPEIH